MPISRPTSAIPALAGRKAKVAVKIMRVQEPNLPEVDEAFIASFGIGEGGMEKFREDVRANLERELKGVLPRRLKNEVVQKLVDAYPDIDLPETMVTAEASALVQQAQMQAQQQGQQMRRRTPNRSARGAPPRRCRLPARRTCPPERGAPRQPRVAEALATIASTYEEPEKVVELYHTRSPTDEQPAEPRAGGPGRRMGRRACQADRAEAELQ